MLDQQRKRAKMLEKEEEKDVMEEAKIEDASRKFVEPLRPNN